MLFTNLIQTNLQTSFIGRNIEYFSFTESTNDDAFEFINNNEAEDGMLIITDNQTNGRGRRNNKWHSSPGNNLTFSLILKKTDDPDLSLFSILIGVAIVKGIERFTNINCTLKWPNDIILNKKKIGGILIETKHNSPFFVIGVGLNVNQQEMPVEIEKTASSLRIEKTNPIQREPLLAFILNEFENLYNSESINWIAEWKKYCDHINKPVSFNHNNELVNGLFIDINNDGNAIVNIEEQQVIISSGVLEIL
tara:strand:- start:88 stop:840 length:753 start_codon:yes stop_codon:yes gene_type:complete